VLEHIRTFEAVVRTGSFSAAGRELHKAQSAVSYGVQQLEERLGLELFDRSGHRAVLTNAGRALLAEGEKLIEAASRIEELASRIGDGYEPRLQLVIDGIVPQEPIMRALKTLADEHNPTQIQVKVEFLGGVQYRFEREDADIMIVKNFDAGTGYHETTLPFIESVLVCSPDHPLARASAAQVGLLHDYVELSVHDSSGATPAHDPTAFGGSRIFYLSDFGAKRQALRLGLGFGWMPTYLADEDLAAGRLVEVDFEGGSRYSFLPRLVSRATRARGRTAERFAELVLKAVEKSWT
jgi:DNA-binding transcriptional LysR family regulator